MKLIREFPVLDSIAAIIVPIHREGHKFMAMFVVATILMFVFLPDLFGWVGVVLTVWCAYFFRDPERVTPLREGLVISPADGKICAIEDVVAPVELELDEQIRTRICIFMNVFDVHVNRAPHAGRITQIAYVPGKFFNAELDKASKHNERQAFTLLTPAGERLGIVQIAGLVARRIVKFVDDGDSVGAGERIGLIRFGSRVDVYLPPGKAAQVCIGQRAIAGETVLADLNSGEPEREARES